MNNKVLARIVATVMAIAMLGTVSFAASISGDEINVTAPAGYDTTQEQKTMIAYYAATDSAEPATADIIAIAQADESGNLAEAFKFDTTKTPSSTARNYIIVRYGGTDGSTSSVTLALNGTEAEVTPVTTFEANGTLYENVAHFTQTIPAGASVGTYGFKIWRAAEADEEGNPVYKGKTSDTNPLYFTNETEFSGGGESSFGILIVGVQDGITLKAKSFYTE